MNQTDVDVSHLVDAAFKDIQCDAKSERPHDGDITALMRGHECWQGMVCYGHLQNYIENKRPKILEKFARNGYIRCSECNEKFYDLDAFFKVYPL